MSEDIVRLFEEAIDKLSAHGEIFKPRRGYVQKV